MIPIRRRISEGVIEFTASVTDCAARSRGIRTRTARTRARTTRRYPVREKDGEEYHALRLPSPSPARERSQGRGGDRGEAGNGEGWRAPWRFASSPCAVHPRVWEKSCKGCKDRILRDEPTLHP